MSQLKDHRNDTNPMIRRLLQLNGVAILCVVANHAIGWGFVAMFWWVHRYRPVTAPNFDQFGDTSYYGLRTLEQLIVACIPAFLFVSGFFVAVATGRNQPNITWSVVRTRIIGLAIPYLLWSLIIFATDFVLLDVQYSAGKYLMLLLVGGATSAFYYVPLVCQLYLLSPLLVPLAKHKWKVLLLVALLIQLIAELAHYPAILAPQSSLALAIARWAPDWTLPGHQFWFVLGIVVGFHLPEFKAWAHGKRWFFVALAGIMVPVGILEWELLLRFSGQQWLAPVRILSDELFSGAVIIAFLAFDNLTLPLSSRISALGTKSYGIYLVHSLVLTWVAKLVYHLAPWILSNQFIFQLMLVVLGLGVPLLLMSAVNLSPARKYYQFIFG